MTKPYPGMIDESLEFFTFEDKLKVIKNGQVQNFQDLSFADIQILKDVIDSKIEIKLALHDMEPASEMQRIKKFVHCNFGGLDYQADIKEGILQDGEFWPCPNRGSCPHEGVVCKLPIYNGTRLTKQDVQLMQLNASEMTNEVIAETLSLPMGTFHQKKKNLHDKLGVQTKQGTTQIAHYLALI